MNTRRHIFKIVFNAVNYLSIVESRAEYYRNVLNDYVKNNIEKNGYETFA